jgi:hypothetical protein
MRRSSLAKVGFSCFGTFLFSKLSMHRPRDAPADFFNIVASLSILLLRNAATANQKTALSRTRPRDAYHGYKKPAGTFLLGIAEL